MNFTGEKTDEIVSPENEAKGHQVDKNACTHNGYFYCDVTTLWGGTYISEFLESKIIYDIKIFLSWFCY